MPNTPNMSLPLSTVGFSTGLRWQQNLNSSLDIIDGHDHSPGKGVPINSNSLSISLDLPLNNNNLTLVRSVRFQPQSLPLSGVADIGCLYESGVDLWYNDGLGNQIQITMSGSVNASSSGISNPPASASFVSSVLVVDAAANTPANIQGASILLGNNVANSKYLTLSPPNAMPANYQLVLPSLPPGQQIMTLDSSGNITAPYTVDNSTLSIVSNVIGVATGGITNTQIADHTITVDKLAPTALVASPAPIGQVMSINGSFGPANTGGVYVSVNSGTLDTGGRPIMIMLSPDGTNTLSGIQFAGAFPTGGIEIQVDSVVVAQFQFGLPTAGGSSQINYGLPSVICIVPVSAGTHTIELFAANFSGSSVAILNAAFNAYEI